MKLYELTEQIQEVLNNIDYIDEQTFNDTMESLQYDLHEKAEAYAKVIKTLDAEVDGVKKEILRLSDMKSTRENRIEYLKRNLEQAMILADDKKFKTDLFSFNVQNNAPSLDIADDAKIPSEYYIEQEPKLDRKALLDAIKTGHEIEGVGIKQTESIRIK